MEAIIVLPAHLEATLVQVGLQLVLLVLLGHTLQQAKACVACVLQEHSRKTQGNVFHAHLVVFLWQVLLPVIHVVPATTQTRVDSPPAAHAQLALIQTMQLAQPPVCNVHLEATAQVGCQEKSHAQLDITALLEHPTTRSRCTAQNLL